MNDSDRQTIDKLVHIKQKLTKYTELKSNNKINEYLSALNQIEVNLEVLKRTEIVNLLKELKKKENPAFSPKANQLILKWKTKFELDRAKPAESTPTPPAPAVNGSKPTSNPKKEPSNPTKAKQSPATQPPPSKPLSKKPDSPAKPPSKPAPVQPSGTQPKKRPSSTLLKKPEPENSPSKKQKISLSDYKLLKGNSGGSSATADASQDEEEDFDQYFNEESSNSSESTLKLPVSPQKPKSKLPLAAPPLPLAPLTKNFLTETVSTKVTAAAEPYEPTPIARALPRIPTATFAALATTNVKPVNNALIDDEALSKIFHSKHSKKVLYTGKRTNAGGPNSQVQKLYDLSIRACVENLDDLANRISIYNMNNDFPIAFDLIKPVLERASAKQLESIEYYSPHLLNDTDYMWKKLCEHEFKNTEPPDEDESWRELYFRKADEREEKFQRARKIVSSMQLNKPKERQTQMATVKFVSSHGRSSASNRRVTTVTTTKTSSSSTPSASSSSATKGPVAGQVVRTIISESAAKKPYMGTMGSKKPMAPQAPHMSQGMKATMKLIKKTMRR